MEILIIIAFLLPLALIVGAVLGFVAFTRVNSLQRDIAHLRNQLDCLWNEKQKTAQTESSVSTPVTAPAIDNTEPDKNEAVEEEPAVAGSAVTAAPASQLPEATFPETEISETTAFATSHSLPSKPSPFITHLLHNWMVWLGGFCVSLAGIFLAKYSIEKGLLGPGARVTLGVLTGLALHGGAVWLRAKYGTHSALAALAGGGSITLFAALLAALHFYHMFSPLTVFVLLAVVAVVTMWLALQYGPVLAVIGMLGAYAVPMMVSTGSGNIVAAMVYALIISASVLMLLRYVKAPWLWWGLLAGGLFWWAISLTSSQPDGWRGFYLAIFAYGLIAFTNSNWRLDKQALSGVWPFTSGDASPSQEINWLAPSLLLVVVAQIVSVFAQGWEGQWLNWSLLAALLLWVAGKQPKFAALAWLLFVGEWLAILLPQLQETRGQFYFRLLQPEVISAFFQFLFIVTALYVGIGLRNLKLGQAKNWWAAMVAVVPVLALLLAHLLGANFTSNIQWALVIFTLGVLYVGLASIGIQKQWTQELYVWLFLAGHFAYSIAATVLLAQATLTLAIAAQILSIAWLIRRFNVTHIGWLLKTVVVLVVIRLTVNPWLASYPADAHWPLWTYGGATLFCFIGARWLTAHAQLNRWAEVATLHLFALTVWAEARYVLYDGAAFNAKFTFNEAVLNCLLFGTLALVYHFKAKASQTLSKWYRTYSLIQLAFAACNYMVLVFALLISTPWVIDAVGSTPIWNILLLAYGLPVVLAYFIYRFYLPELRKAAVLSAAVAGFIFISLEIHHLWQGSVSLNLPVSVGELYTYSIVWLLMAVSALLLGSWKFGKQCYQGGLVLLALVIGKIFLIDMAGLDGLLRVASFMGLGLALLAIAFLHQKLGAKLSAKAE